MRIRIDEEEYQVTLKPEGNTIVNGRAISWNGNLLEGVEDITEYDEEGNEIEPREVPDPFPEYTTAWTITTIKLFMDEYEILYNSGDTKLDLVNKCRIAYGLPVVT